MLWGMLENLDINTYHPVLTVRPGSPALQAILIFEDAPFPLPVKPLSIWVRGCMLCSMLGNSLTVWCVVL